MTNTGSEYRRSVLPFLPTRKDTSEASLRKMGKIIRQNGEQMRNMIIPSSQSELIDVKASNSSQKSFNQLALSLMGVKRSRVNRSCFEKRTSFDFKKDYEKQFKDKGDVQVYAQSALPFRAEDIKYLQDSINGLVMRKQL